MGSALFTKWSSAEDNGNCQGHYEERKRALCGTENVCHTRLYILIFSWDFRGCQTLPFLRGQTMPKFPKNTALQPYFTFEVERRVTSWAPPSTMDTEDTSVSLASRCRSGMLVTPTLHMVDFTLYREDSTLSCREPA